MAQQTTSTDTVRGRPNESEHVTRKTPANEAVKVVELEPRANDPVSDPCSGMTQAKDRIEFAAYTTRTTHQHITPSAVRATQVLGSKTVRTTTGLRERHVDDVSRGAGGESGCPREWST